MSIAKRIAGWGKMPILGSGDMPLQAFLVFPMDPRFRQMCEREIAVNSALRDRLRDTAAVLEELACADISSCGCPSKYDEMQLPRGLQADARAIVARLTEEGLLGWSAQEDKT